MSSSSFPIDFAISESLPQKLLSDFFSLDSFPKTLSFFPSVFDLPLTGLTLSSSEVLSGNAFFALQGLHADGHQFIPHALKKGAVCIIHTQPLTPSSFVEYFPQKENKICFIQVLPEHIKQTFALWSNFFYDDPSKTLATFGVTGTDGKSTTIFLVSQILNALSEIHPELFPQKQSLRCGFFSTVAWDLGEGLSPNTQRQSTPEAHTIFAALKKIKNAGYQAAAIECTSHGLSLKTHRLSQMRLNSAAITNIFHEHLDFHGNEQGYFEDKMRIASLLKPGGTLILPFENPSLKRYTDFLEKNAPQIPFLTFSLSNPKSTLSSQNIQATSKSVSFEALHEHTAIPLILPFPGTFNIENLFCALLLIHSTFHIPLSKILHALPEILPNLTLPRGRMNSVDEGQDFTVLIDYAHTPSAFEKILPMIKKATPGNLWVVFGSAGERDREKRPLQGKIASQYAQKIILCDEDPREEPSLEILKEIYAGILPEKKSHTFLIPNRTQALQKAIQEAQPGDTVLALGKGHEESMFYPGEKRPWNEYHTLQALLKERLEEAKHPTEIKNKPFKEFSHD